MSSMSQKLVETWIQRKPELLLHFDWHYDLAGLLIVTNSYAIKISHLCLLPSWWQIYGNEGIIILIRLCRLIVQTGLHNSPVIASCNHLNLAWHSSKSHRPCFSGDLGLVSKLWSEFAENVAWIARLTWDSMCILQQFSCIFGVQHM